MFLQKAFSMFQKIALGYFSEGPKGVKILKNKSCILKQFQISYEHSKIHHQLFSQKGCTSLFCPPAVDKYIHEHWVLLRKLLQKKNVKNVFLLFLNIFFGRKTPSQILFWSLYRRRQILYAFFIYCFLSILYSLMYQKMMP